MKITVLSLCLLLSLHMKAACPDPAKYGPKWPGTNANPVAIVVDTSSLSPLIKVQVDKALAAWNQSGISPAVSFGSPAADGSSTVVYKFSEGKTKDPHAGAATTITALGNRIITAETVIGIDNTLGGSSDPIYSPTQLGYATLFLKVALHEIGHTLGLPDVKDGDQTRGQTVMNQISGTNDKNGMMAANLGDCEKQAMKTLYPPPPPSGCSIAPMPGVAPSDSCGNDPGPPPQAGCSVSSTTFQNNESIAASCAGISDCWSNVQITTWACDDGNGGTVYVDTSQTLSVTCGPLSIGCEQDRDCMDATGFSSAACDQGTGNCVAACAIKVPPSPNLKTQRIKPVDFFVQPRRRPIKNAPWITN